MMMTLEQLVDSLDDKIQLYRKEQHLATRTRSCLRDAQRSLLPAAPLLPAVISKQIEELKHEASERIVAIAGYCNSMLQKQGADYQEEIFELRGEMSRQHKVINLLKQELEDLMLMINERKIDEEEELPLPLVPS